MTALEDGPRRARTVLRSVLLALALAAPARAELAGQAPVDYVLATAQRHRVVILGEFHWIRHDAALVRDLVPKLAGAGIGTLAVEVFPASEQDRIDRLLAAPAWDPAGAMAVLRAGAWPYREHLQILEAAWAANRSAPLRLLALGPGEDWRSVLLPQGRTYDSFMADKVAAAAGGRVLVYCGLNHGFTRYQQPEMPRGARVEAFMDRMGNLLRRRFGEEVFLVLLHRPWQRRAGRDWEYVLPLEGRIDCAADGGPPRGFDIAGSAWAEARISPDHYFGLGHPAMRLVDLADGYIWTAPVERTRLATLIPLAEFAPDPAALAEVAANCPFSDRPGPDRAALQALWDKEADGQGDYLRKFRMEALRGWRKGCSPPVRPASAAGPPATPAGGR